jgi:hypothetical protein
MNRLWLIFLFIVVFLNGYSQTFEFINAISIVAPTGVSTDTNGNVYYATFNGDVVRYDGQLLHKEIFSPQNPARIDQLEAWQGLRIFTFHRELQLYRLINRNLSMNEDYQFPADLVGFVQLAAPTFDNNIWLIDQEDFSLKRYQIHSNTIPVVSPLSLLLNAKKYEIRWMREYQNRLFVGVINVGILLFDNMGNYIKTFEEPEMSDLGFLGDAVYYIKDGQMVQINIYDDEKKLVPLPSGGPWKFIILSVSDLYLFSDIEIAHYRVIPE